MPEIEIFEGLVEVFYDFYGKGEYNQALDLLKRESNRFPKYEIVSTWFKVRMMVLTGDMANAIKLLSEAVSKGDWYHEDALHNFPDLAGVQGLPEFEDLVERCQDRRLKAVAETKSSLMILEPKNHPRPWPLLLSLQSQDPDYASYWKAALDEGWLVAISQSSQVGWYRGMTVWDDFERTTNEIHQHLNVLSEKYAFNQDQIVIAAFSAHCQTALQVALSNHFNLSGIIAVEAWLPDVSVWEPIIETSENLSLRGYFIAGEENIKYTEQAKKIVEFLNSHSIPSKREGTSNTYHRFPPEFDESLKRALRFIANQG
jgi:predicted esterase